MMYLTKIRKNTYKYCENFGCFGAKKPKVKYQLSGGRKNVYSPTRFSPKCQHIAAFLCVRRRSIATKLQEKKFLFSFSRRRNPEKIVASCHSKRCWPVLGQEFV